MGGDSIEWFTGTIASLAEGPDIKSSAEPAIAAAPVASRLVDEGEIARGGMGAVHKVHDVVILRHAAMKVLGSRERADARLRFLREAQMTGQLDHPNIVPVYDL